MSRMTTPFSRFLSGLHAIRADFNEEMEELLAFAEVMARKHNTLELDEHGDFYVTAQGPLDEIIPALKTHIGKLERIQKQRDGV